MNLTSKWTYRQTALPDLTLAPGCCGPSIADPDEWFDQKDVWLPDGELLKFLDAKAALARAGYVVRRAELIEIQPIWLFELIQDGAAPIQDAKCLRLHIRRTMWEARVFYRDSNAMIQRSGKRIIASFLWPVPADRHRREAIWSESRFQMLLGDLP